MYRFEHPLSLPIYYKGLTPLLFYLITRTNEHSRSLDGEAN